MSRLVKVKLALVDKDHLIANQYVSDASGQWERKLESISALRRTVTLDRTFERGGFSLVVDDQDYAYQTMFKSDTNRKIYGKAVTVYAYKKDGATLADTITATIRGWRRNGATVVFDCVQEFAGAMDAIPQAQDLVINTTDFPDASGRALGKPVLFPTGVCYGHWGKIECWKVIKRNIGLGIDAKYLITKSDPAGAARITTIDTVYETGVRILPASRYSLVRDVNGWEYVNYNGGDNRIRINCTAVSNPGTAGANPVVALRAVLTAAGVTLVDDGAGGATDFQDYCTAQTWAMGGNPEGVITTKDYLESWCREFNCFWRVDSAGAVHIKHFDWAAITADAILTEQHFAEFNEVADMSEFANRFRSKSEYGNATWNTETITNSTTGDYLPATLPMEQSEEYLLAAFGGATTPIAEKLRFQDRVKQVSSAIIDLEQYEISGLELLKVATATHSRQIGDAGKYLVMDETIDWINETVSVELFRLWGV
jgi:hypothetical protein